MTFQQLKQYNIPNLTHCMKQNDNLFVGVSQNDTNLTVLLFDKDYKTICKYDIQVEQLEKSLLQKAIKLIKPPTLKSFRPVASNDTFVLAFTFNGQSYFYFFSFDPARFLLDQQKYQLEITNLVQMGGFYVSTASEILRIDVRTQPDQLFVADEKHKIGLVTVFDAVAFNGFN